MLGVLANSLAVLIGGVIGMLFGSRIKSKYTDSLMVALGLANMWLAVFADVGVMILAVLNAIRALFVKNL